MAKGKSVKGAVSGSTSKAKNIGTVIPKDSVISQSGKFFGKQVVTPAPTNVPSNGVVLQKAQPASSIGGSPVGGVTPRGTNIGSIGNATVASAAQTGQGATLATGAQKPTGVNTTSTPAGNNTITPNSQTGGNGNATTNPYGNAFQTYKTNMEKSKNAQMGQLDTEYNRQKESIEGNANNLNRNAYVTYMQRNLANRDLISNLGAARSGLAEKINTANMADYNRSVGNVGAYRTTQLSDAENAYNQNRQNLENEYNNNLTEKEAEYENLRIGRENELADLQRNLDFTAAENAKDREQQAREAQQAYDQAEKQFIYQRQQDRFNTFTDTVSQYDTPQKAQDAITAYEKKRADGKLEPWEEEHYSDIMYYLRAQKNTATQAAKAAGKSTKVTSKKSTSKKSTSKKSTSKKSDSKKSTSKKSSSKKSNKKK